MKEYKVIISPLAQRDISNYVEYIAFDKKEPDIALGLSDGFKKEIAKLGTCPYRHEVDEDEELARYEIRKHYYKSYKIYFVIDEKEDAVYVLRVLHMRVDSRVLLLNIFRD